MCNTWHTVLMVLYLVTTPDHMFLKVDLLSSHTANHFWFLSRLWSGVSCFSPRWYYQQQNFPNPVQEWRGCGQRCPPLQSDDASRWEEGKVKTEVVIFFYIMPLVTLGQSWHTLQARPVEFLCQQHFGDKVDFFFFFRNPNLYISQDKYPCQNCFYLIFCGAQLFTHLKSPVLRVRFPCSNGALLSISNSLLVLRAWSHQPVVWKYVRFIRDDNIK